MNQERVLSFGKYKGQEVKYIILTHIGYIMWCFENLKWFKLTDEEQALYDAIAIMIKKYKLQMTFPVELMYKHIKNKELFEKLETPFICRNRYTSFRKTDEDNPVCKSVEKYVLFYSKELSINDVCRSISHSMTKLIDSAICDFEPDEEIFGGWCSMHDYKD